MLPPKQRKFFVFKSKSERLNAFDSKDFSTNEVILKGQVADCPVSDMILFLVGVESVVANGIAPAH